MSVGQEPLDVPFPEMIASMGQGIADAQNQLDKNSAEAAKILADTEIDVVPAIEVAGPDPEAEGFFFVKRRGAVDHSTFLTGLLGQVGTSGRLVLHHRSGFAIVRLPHERARRLGRLPWIETVGGTQFDPERFAAIAGAPVA